MNPEKRKDREHHDDQADEIDNAVHVRDLLCIPLNCLAAYVFRVMYEFAGTPAASAPRNWR